MKITKRSNFRVVIEPETWYKEGHVRYEDDVKGTCNQIIDSVKRHCDNIGHVYMEHETNDVCSHCGYNWEVDETGEPVCCNKAIEEWKLSLAPQSGDQTKINK